MALLCRFRIFLILAVLPVAWAQPSAAQSDIYTVRNVPVDVTADNATQARAQALEEARQKALQSLIDRLVPRNEQGYVPDLSPSRLEQMVRDFEVEEERTSAVRYIAELTIRFNSQAVQRFLQNSRVRYALTRSKPVVLLPVLSTQTGAVLWDEPNPWRQAWSEYPANAGLVPMIVPLGDLSDMAAIDAVEAIAGDQAGLSTVADNYGAVGAVVAQAQTSGDAEAGTARVDVLARWYDLSGGGAGQTVTDSLRQREGEALEDLLYRGADSIASAINESWKQANLISFDQQQSLIAEVRVNGLRQWQQVRSRLQSVSMINGLQLRSLNRLAAMIELSYFGGVDQLQLALSQRDLTLFSDSAAGIWRIAASGSAAAEPTTGLQPGDSSLQGGTAGAASDESEAE
ncbi:MAG: DUF2066 domain-containing protein [Rhodovibrionaceae bacterium]|nr:DUF2066 domain-containing protein [Rhodovibrionaceae bacterium]